MHARLKNPMSAEFGIKTEDDLDDFLNNYLLHFSMVGTVSNHKVGRCLYFRGEAYRKGMTGLIAGVTRFPTNGLYS